MTGSNLSSVGFLFESDGEYQEAMERLANASTVRLAVDDGDYAIWRSRTGAELWFHVIGERQDDGSLAGGGIIGIQAYYEGARVSEVRIERAMAVQEEGPFTGYLIGHIAGSPCSGAAGAPLVFEAIDFAAHAKRDLPFVASARIIGFARVLSAFADRAAFQAAESETAGLDIGSYVPVGLHAVSDGKGIWTTRMPSAHALLVGEVLTRTRHRNEETGLDFHHLILSSSGGPCEVVAEAELVPADLQPGWLVSASCWLVGRLADES